LGTGEEDLSPAPTAHFIRYSSRKGAKAQRAQREEGKREWRMYLAYSFQKKFPVYRYMIEWVWYIGFGAMIRYFKGDKVDE
jgi:hypothetical protein